MARYIDAEELSRKMYHNAFETDSDMQRWDSGCWIRYKMFEDAINDIPTADVRENVKGEWIKFDEGNTVCSLCGFELEDWTQGFFITTVQTAAVI